MDFFLFLLNAVSAAFAAYFSIFVYRRLPSEWLCDYGEVPDLKHAQINRCKNENAAFIILWFMVMIYQYLIFINEIDTLELIKREFFLLIWFIILVSAALSDIDFMIIPDQCCAASAALAVFTAAIEIFPEFDVSKVETSFIAAAADALLAGAFIAVSMLLGRAASPKETIGMGDLKLITACGACIGAEFQESGLDVVLLFFVTAVMLNAAWSAVMLVLGKVGYGDPLPFGPWIAISALLCSAMK